MTFGRTTLLRGRPVTPETLDEVTDRLYESLLREASVNFVSLHRRWTSTTVVLFVLV